MGLKLDNAPAQQHVLRPGVLIPGDADWQHSSKKKNRSIAFQLKHILACD
jgi:hypothetical protein